jgi:putative peptidoglycan lipid II flippase
VYLFVIRGFYAHQDTRTPFVLNVGENLLNVVLAFVFVERWGVLGLGLAFGLAYVVSSGWALQVLSYKVPGFALREIGSSLWRIVLATVLAAEAMWLAGRLVDGTTGTEALGRIALGGSAGVAVYVAALLALRAPELQFLRHRLRPSHA